MALSHNRWKSNPHLVLQFSTSISWHPHFFSAVFLSSADYSSVLLQCRAVMCSFWMDTLVHWQGETKMLCGFCCLDNLWVLNYPAEGSEFMIPIPLSQRKSICPAVLQNVIDRRWKVLNWFCSVPWTRVTSMFCCGIWAPTASAPIPAPAHLQQALSLLPLHEDWELQGQVPWQRD